MEAETLERLFRDLVNVFDKIEMASEDGQFGGIDYSFDRHRLVGELARRGAKKILRACPAAGVRPGVKPQTEGK